MSRQIELVIRYSSIITITIVIFNSSELKSQYVEQQSSVTNINELPHLLQAILNIKPTVFKLGGPQYQLSRQRKPFTQLHHFIYLSIPISNCMANPYPIHSFISHHFVFVRFTIIAVFICFFFACFLLMCPQPYQIKIHSDIRKQKKCSSNTN